MSMRRRRRRSGIREPEGEIRALGVIRIERRSRGSEDWSETGAGGAVAILFMKQGPKGYGLYWQMPQEDGAESRW